MKDDEPMRAGEREDDRMSDEDRRVEAVAAAECHRRASISRITHEERKALVSTARAFVAMYDALRNFDANRATMRELPPFRVNTVVPGIEPDENGRKVIAAVQRMEHESRTALDSERELLTRILQAISTEKGNCDCAATVRRMLGGDVVP